MLVTLEVLKRERFSWLRELQPLNIHPILVTFEVLKFEKFR